MSKSSPNAASATPPDTRQHSPGAFDFKKNVAGFVAKRRGIGASPNAGSAAKASPLSSGVSMTPVVFKEETGQYFEGFPSTSSADAMNEDVKPDIRAMEESLIRESNNCVATDVKPDVSLMSTIDVKPAISQT